MILNNTKLYASLAVLGCLALGAPSDAHAHMNTQGQTQTQMQTKTQAPMSKDQTASVAFSQSQINAFVNAALQVGQIQVDAAPQIKSAQSKEEKIKLYKKMQQNMVGAIKDTDGITLQDYNKISKAAKNDQKLAMIIRQQLKAKQTAQ